MKMKKLLFLILFLPLAPVRASEPVDSYLAETVASAGDNLWWVYPQQIQGVTITPPKGGYIFRIKTDLNGDSVDDVFLTRDDAVMKDGESWTLYRSGTSGSYVKVSDDVWLNGAIWAKIDSGVKKYSYVTPQDKDTALESISTFWIDGSGNFQTSSQQLTDAQSKAINGGDQTLMGANGLPDANKIAQYLQLGSLVTLSIEKVLTGKLYQNSSATWRAVNNNFALSQQYLDPADASDIASLTSWTPPAAP